MSDGKRRHGREVALATLYQLEVNEVPSATAMDCAAQTFGAELPEDPESWAFARMLVAGVQEATQAIDEAIESCSHNWRLSRMAAVDRSILRLATYELMHHPEVPSKVVLNEAVELAKRYGAEDSRSFVNGILDQIARRFAAERGQDGATLKP